MRHPPSPSICRVGILGVGSIAGRYTRGLNAHPDFEVRKIASKSLASAKAFATEHGIEAVDHMLLVDDPDIDLVLNLTPPAAHFALSRAALQAGKHVYSEKPLATSMDQADELIALAHSKNVMLACAPATPLGPVWQKANALIASGRLGRIVGASGSIVYPGPDLFHENPEHLFAPYGGPLFDMGVYHIIALTYLLGPVQSVQAVACPGRPERTIKVGARKDAVFPVTTPTHFVAILTFESGIAATLTCSFEGFGSKAPALEIIGDKATLALPQPGQFTGAIELSEKLFQWTTLEAATRDWSDLDWVAGPVQAWHGFPDAIPLPMSPQFARHTLDIMLSIELAAKRSSVERVKTSFKDT